MKYEVRVHGRTCEVETNGETVRVCGRTVRAVLLGFPGSPVRRLVVDGVSRTLALVRREGGWVVHRGGQALEAVVLDERARSLRDMVGPVHGKKGGGIIRAPMPGLVLRVEVEPGQQVGAGEGLLVLEAMKMENEIRAPGASVVARVLVRAGQAVEKGAELLELAPPQG